MTFSMITIPKEIYIGDSIKKKKKIAIHPESTYCSKFQKFGHHRNGCNADSIQRVLGHSTNDGKKLCKYARKSIPLMLVFVKFGEMKEYDHQTYMKLWQDI